MVTGVTQSTLAERCDECGTITKRGDCASATIATILGLPLDQVPRFVEAGNGMWPWVEGWLARRGLSWRLETDRAKLPHGRLYVSGKSPRGFYHGCVWEGGPDGQIAWDPHPSRAGLTEFLWWGIIEPARDNCPCCGISKSGVA